MDNNAAYIAHLKTMRDEMAECQTRLNRLRSAIQAVSNLCENTTSNSRKTPSRSQLEIPAEMVDMNCSERILHVMRAEPEKTWTNPELASAAHTATTSTARTTMQRLARSGSVVMADTGRWRLTTQGTAVQ